MVFAPAARATAVAVEAYDGYQNVMAAQQNFQEGNYWTGAFHAGLAVLNAIGVKGGIKQLKNDVHIAAFPGDHCYPAGTPLSTQFGQCPIETVQQDDRVWGFNLLTGQWELCRVVETYSREHEGDLVKLFVAGSAIESTYHHPYWVVDGEDLAERPAPDHVRAITVRDAIVPGRWVDAGDLRIGDVLLLQDGRRLPIEEIILRHATCRVYNLAVEGLRNYAVGPCSVLAHNRCVVNTKLPKRVTEELPAGEMRTPAEVKQARNFFERNRDAAKKWYEERTGMPWDKNATHFEHPRPLKDGGDPLLVVPGFGGPNAAHMIPGADGLTDFQRWGRLGGRPRTT